MNGKNYTITPLTVKAEVPPATRVSYIANTPGSCYSEGIPLAGVIVYRQPSPSPRSDRCRSGRTRAARRNQRLQSPRRTHLLEIVRDNVLNLFNIVLFTLLVIVLILQDYATVLFAGFSVVTNSILGMAQEIAAKRKLDRLAALAAQDVSVWRDGQLTAVPAQALVKDDVIPISRATAWWWMVASSAAVRWK